MRDLVLATRNRGKVQELKAYLAGLPVRLHTADELSLPPVEETGSTMKENARLKAVHYSRHTEHVVLSDDSGLEVNALGGEPGVHSARFGGAGLTDRQRTELLLKKLDGTEWEDRAARFVCVVVLARGGAVIQSFEGICSGTIAFEPRGTHGFGYDPVFYHSRSLKTFAEMEPDKKRRVSHRGKALEACHRYLEEME